MDTTMADKRVDAKDKTTAKRKLWRTWHVMAYATIGVFGSVSSVVYYAGLSRSDFQCYQYKAMLMMHDYSRDVYEAHMTGDTTNAWYKNEYCFEAFAYPLRLAVFCAVGTALSLVFGRGGTCASDYNNSEYFSIDGQWQLVFWAGLLNGYHSLKSLVVALQFTDGYRKFMETVSRLPEDDQFRRKFETTEQPYYVTYIILLWSLNVLCTLNFILIIFRCGTGIDFDDDFNDNPENVQSADQEPAGPPDRPTSVSVLNENIGENVRYKYYFGERSTN